MELLKFNTPQGTYNKTSPMSPMSANCNYSMVMMIGLKQIELVQIKIHPLGRDNFIEKRKQISQEIKHVRNMLKLGIKLNWDYKTKDLIISTCAKLGLYRYLVDITNIIESSEFKQSIQEAMIALARVKKRLVIDATSIYLFVPRKPNTNGKHVWSAFLSLLDTINSRNSDDNDIHYAKFLIGYIMIFCSNYLYKCINEWSVSSKKQSATTSQLKIAKTMLANDIHREGKKYFFTECAILDQKEIMISSVNYCRGHYEWLINKDFDKAKMYFVFCITSDYKNGSLICKFRCLIAMRDICYDTNELLLAKRLYRAAKKLSDGYFIDGLLIQRYCDNVALKCEYCESITNVGMKCCKGCMDTYYCNKKCQKRHWIIHKHKCKQTWKYLYFALKACIFDPLK